MPMDTMAANTLAAMRSGGSSASRGRGRARVLIVAIGNPLRSDDGLAWHAADLLEKTIPPAQAEILRLHQLTPELAETVSRYETVIFVDAAVGDGQETVGEPQFRVISIMPDTVDLIRFSHALSSASVLGLSADLYGETPRAFSATLPGRNFDHGESLSPEVAAALPKLAEAIAKLVHASAA
jgi:hydrogenase maturation protease